MILATGSVPRTIPGFEVDGRFVMTSDEVLDLEQLPESAVVVGGGAIGCEFASMLSDMGVRVTILEALPKILPGVDKDVADVVVQVVQAPGHRHPDRRDRLQAHPERGRQVDGGASSKPDSEAREVVPRSSTSRPSWCPSGAGPSATTSSPPAVVWKWTSGAS